MAETEADVQAEFHATLNDLAGVHEVATRGVPLCLKDWEPAFQQFGERGDAETVSIGHGAPGAPGTLSYYHTTVGEMRVKLASDGPVVGQLGQQWLVMVFTQWEHEYRPRLAVVRGVEVSEVAMPVMGDIRLMRNDVVHHRGFATKDNTGRCQVLRWFQAGEAMAVTSQMVAEFMGHHGLLRPAQAAARSAKRSAR